MDNFLKSVYVTEIKAQCKFALAAIKQLNHALQQLHAQDMRHDQRMFFQSEVFRQVHSFLTHASNVSRMFWPSIPIQRKNESEEKYAKRLNELNSVVRAKHLKSEYRISDQSPLKDRRLRDHLEHYDERLDHWRETSVHRNMASDIIGPANAIVGLDATDAMRWFDPTRNVFKFRNEEFDLQIIATTIDQLHGQSTQLEQELRNRGLNQL